MKRNSKEKTVVRFYCGISSDVLRCIFEKGVVFFSFNSTDVLVEQVRKGLFLTEEEVEEMKLFLKNYLFRRVGFIKDGIFLTMNFSVARSYAISSCERVNNIIEEAILYIMRKKHLSRKSIFTFIEKRKPVILVIEVPEKFLSKEIIEKIKCLQNNRVFEVKEIFNGKVKGKIVDLILV